MGSASPVTRPAGDRVPGRLAAFTTRAVRELLFCLIEVPLGLCILLIPAGLGILSLGLTVLVHGSHPPQPAHAQPGGVVTAFGVAVIVVLLALLFLAPRIARRLGAVHRGLAARLLGEHIAGPPPIRRGGEPAAG